MRPVHKHTLSDFTNTNENIGCGVMLDVDQATGSANLLESDRATRSFEPINDECIVYLFVSLFLSIVLSSETIKLLHTTSPSI